MNGKVTVNIPNPVIKDWTKHRDMYKNAKAWKEKKFDPMIAKLRSTLKEKYPTQDMEQLNDELKMNLESRKQDQMYKIRK